MLSAYECILKAENYAAAARLDHPGPGRSELMRLAAMWRARAVRTAARAMGIHITERDMDRRHESN